MDLKVHYYRQQFLPKVSKQALKTMKLITIILFAACIQVSARGYSQITLSETNTPLQKVLQEIQQQSGYDFVATYETVKESGNITVNVQNVSLQKALDECLKGKPLTYVIIGKTVALHSEEKTDYNVNTAINAMDLIPPPVEIHGRVVNQKGEPLPNVSVLIAGTKIGTTTDSDGRFTLTSPNNKNVVLEISSVGYQKKKVSVGKQTEIDVTLELEAKGLNEVVVVGYGTERKRDLTGAIETVSSKELESRTTNNVGAALQGVVPNLTITRSGGGQANYTPSYDIRGMTSLNGGSPLILVDGVPTGASDFSRMNLDDIKSISVIKDASAAAIYGARAAYGVILVETKSGEVNKKLTVNFNNYFSIRKLGRIPQVVLDPVIETSYKQIMGQPWYNLYTDQQIEYAKKVKEDPTLPTVIPDYTHPEEWQYFAQTDWFRKIFKGSATTMSSQLSISGGSKRASYFVSAEYYSQKGILRYNTDVYNNLNMRSKVNFKLTNWLSISNNTSLQSYNYKAPTEYNPWVFGTAFQANSLLPVHNPDGTLTKGSRMGSVAEGNIVGALENAGESTTKSNLVQNQIQAKFKIIKDVWDLKADFTTRYAYSNGHSMQSDREIPYRTGPNLPLQYLGWDNYAQLNNSYDLYNLINIYSNFLFERGNHKLNLLLGYSQEFEKNDASSSQRKDLITDSYPTVELANGESTINESIYEWAIRSGFFRANYTFKDRYIFELNARLDGSSRFPKNDRYGLFPSFSSGWIISDEPFFKSMKNIANFLKLRASYGALGNQDVSNYYAYLPSMNASKLNLLINGEEPMAIYPPGLVSNNLTWEKVHTSNLGIDLNLFSNKLSFSLDIYQRETLGMLAKGRTLPNVLGTAEPQVNAADLKTKGWELSLKWKDKIGLNTSVFNYSVRFTLADNHAFITKYNNPTGYLGDHYVGEELGEIRGLVTEGFFTSQADIEKHADQSAVVAYPGDRPLEPGDLKYKDLNSDGKIDKGNWTLADPGDFKIIGNSHPRYHFGLTLNSNFKGFDLRIFLQGVAKQDWYPDSYLFWGIYWAPWGNVLKQNLNHWTPDNPNGYFPRLKSYLGNGAGDMSIPQTRYLQNASYVRFKDLTFGYSLPEKIIKNWGVESFRIYFNGEDLFLLTKIPNGYDPESLAGMVEPFQRTFSFGFNLTF